MRWRGRDEIEVTNVYIEPTYKSIGYRAASGGVLYRPYDGKLRPKSWEDFESGEFYWKDIVHFKRGLEASRNFRRKSFIAEWYRGMTEAQRLDLKRVLAAIDAGETVETDDVPADEV